MYSVVCPYPLSGYLQRFVAAVGTGCRGWAGRQPVLLDLSRPVWERPLAQLTRYSGPCCPARRSELPYLRACEQLYIKPNNKEKEVLLLVSIWTQGVSTTKHNTTRTKNRQNTKNPTTHVNSERNTRRNSRITNVTLDITS